MKKFFINLILTIILLLNSFCLFYYLDNIGILKNAADVLYDIFSRESTTLVNNVYSKNINNNFVSITSDFTPESKQDLLNIYYTVFSSGMDNFIFYCPNEYTACIDDVQSITSDNMALSHINNFIHSFNSFLSVKTTYTTTGRITLKINKAYTEEKIDEVNKAIDEIYNTLVSKDKTDTENIRSVHDYIIENVIYDDDYVAGISNYEANNAYGSLIQGHAVCSGYTDLMEIFLDRMDIPNHKVSNDKHVWNLVKIDNKWLHLDLTWDDGYEGYDGYNISKYDYFLIDTNKLHELDIKEHTFDENVYSH